MSWASRRLRGPDPVRAPPPRGPRDANPGIRGRPSRPLSLHSGSFGAETESGATEVGLQGRTANQGGRRREAGEGVGAPFPPLPKSAPAGQAGLLPGRPGWWDEGKHRPSGGGSRDCATPPSVSPSKAAALAQPPSPFPGKLCWGAGGETWGGRFWI